MLRSRLAVRLLDIGAAPHTATTPSRSRFFLFARRKFARAILTKRRHFATLSGPRQRFVYYKPLSRPRRKKQNFCFFRKFSTVCMYSLYRGRLARTCVARHRWSKGDPSDVALTLNEKGHHGHQTAGSQVGA
ncbi:hypothetical protein BDI4_60109 [Burkholderia diffusa]|nr:hypothetical protein BDI4_60109 [Burkholderia diffusa]